MSVVWRGGLSRAVMRARTIAHRAGPAGRWPRPRMRASARRAYDVRDAHVFDVRESSAAGSHRPEPSGTHRRHVRLRPWGPGRVGELRIVHGIGLRSPAGRGARPRPARGWAPSGGPRRRDRASRRASSRDRSRLSRPCGAPFAGIGERPRRGARRSSRRRPPRDGAYARALAVLPFSMAADTIRSASSASPQRTIFTHLPGSRSL